jgi:hypothetical protein
MIPTIQTTIGTNSPYGKSRSIGILQGLSAPGTGGDASRNAYASALANQQKAQMNQRMAAANLSNDIESQQARSDDLSRQAALYSQRQTDLANRRNQTTLLDAQEQSDVMGNSERGVRIAQGVAGSVLGGLLNNAPRQPQVRRPTNQMEPLLRQQQMDAQLRDMQAWANLGTVTNPYVRWG